ncbi:chromo (CHRromatin organization MOdifier) domain-containing protein [Pochonia chlamydosporia 170]|uniref:Chromo (CHRromatin organization MOdifier) domain-containing protein n=1 Tax=Pochonia chlamydosporia 170 TaxID=1380566 RepID=A0A179EXZ4_METCM|nr:chromo (CHRromatin organization MOdifier) domain-containing protein [Pochonia chlamydosporia 170]OAQ58054.1 chromo (CHRromatin organization MOdifier) domain-containing protein [Pochonia chlamydosporia 170]
MATLVSLDDQRIWVPPKHKSAKGSFGKASSCKQQGLSQQDRAARSRQDGSVLPKSAPSHCQMTSNDVIIISSDEESDTGDEDDGVNDTLQGPRPHQPHSSVAGSDASGEWVESCHRRTDENPPQLLGTADHHTIASPPADEQDPAQAEPISPAPSRYMANDSMETPVTQFVSVPRTSGFSGKIAPERADSFEAALESDGEFCPSRQLQTRGTTLPNHNDFVDNSDNADAASNFRQQRKSSSMLVQPGDDATVGNPTHGGELSNTSSDDAQEFSGCGRQGCQTVGSETQSLEEAHSGAATAENAEGRTRMPNASGGSNKRRRRKARESSGEGSDSDGEFIPTRKLRKASSHRHKPNPSYYRKSKRYATEPQTRNQRKILPASGDHNMDTTIANYEEWFLSDAMLKCIRDNGTMTFQMQFTHTPSPCGIHAKHPQKTTNESPKGMHQPQSHAIKPKDRRLLDENSLTPKQDVLTHQASPNESDDTDIYKAELLARRGKNIFFLRWDIDGSTGWEPRRNILDKKMLQNFESTYVGFDQGVDVLSTRESKQGKRQCLLHFHGRPQAEDSWVKEELLSPNLLETARQSGLDFVCTPQSIKLTITTVVKHTPTDSKDDAADNRGHGGE